MKNICFYFQVHQPFRMQRYNIFDVGKNHSYFDDKKNREVCQKVAKKCYMPANNLMLDLIRKTDGRFKCAYSISGVALDQFEEYSPEVIQSFKDLASSGVEILDETYHHSLSYLYSKEEFKEQVKMHRDKVWELFKQKPQVFRNTELIYNNELAHFVEQLGYKAILAEGWDPILQWRSPNYVYKPAYAKNIKLLLKNYKLSDDLAFRFSDKHWGEHPLTAEKYASWVESTEGETINLFMDYETFGEHQWEDTGIFQFLEHMPWRMFDRNIGFTTPSELAKKDPIGEIDMHNMVSWADVERDLSAWLGNKMQHAAIQQLYDLEKQVKASGDASILNDWRKLTTSDHFYYMCTKWFADGDVHKYFNPHDSPYDAFMAFMNIMNDLTLRINENNPANQTQPAWQAAQMNTINPTSLRYG